MQVETNVKHSAPVNEDQKRLIGMFFSFKSLSLTSIGSDIWAKMKLRMIWDAQVHPMLMYIIMFV